MIILVKEDIDKREAIRKAIESKKQSIQSDNPMVEITRMNIEAVGKLADGNNDIFSQLTKDNLQDETFDYALAMSLAVNPLRNMEERLKRKGITQKVLVKHDLGEIEEERPIRIQITSLINFLKEFLVRRHCLNRNRVEEYIEALRKANGTDNLILPTESPKKGIFNRLG